MKNIGIIVNNKKDPEFKNLKYLTELLFEAGFQPVVSFEYKNILPDKKFFKTSLEEMFKISYMVITLGGDGTLLNIADLAVRYDVAILGVNLGTLGYLAQLNKTEINKIPQILNGEVTYQDRMMLTVTVKRNGNKVYEYSALNDVVVTRGAVLKPVYIDLLGDSGIIANYFCDGLVFSTPTGSTAYSLSVGGPIMEPTLDAILVSAIAPHSLAAHSLVFTSDKTLECRVRSAKTINALISVDGRHVFYLQNDDRIIVNRNNKCLKLLKLTDSDFYSVLKNKFSSRGV